MIQPEKTRDLDLDVTPDPSAHAAGSDLAAPQQAATTEAPSPQPHPLSAEQIQELLEAFEREAKALGNDPAAARLHHEMGLLREGLLKNPRQAAGCYQRAYQLSRKFVSNLRAARLLFSEVGNWEMVAQLLDAEASGSATDSERLALMLEKARVLENRLGKSDDAFAILLQCRERWGDQLPLLNALEAALATRGDAAGLKDAHVALAGAVQDPALSAVHLVAAARLSENALGQPSDAADLFRKAFAVQRRDSAVLAAIELLAERKGDRDELLASLEAQAELAGPSGASFWCRISRAHEQMGQPEKALDALLLGRRVAPNDPLLLDELARVFESTGRWTELAEALQARIAGLADMRERAQLNVQLASLYEDVLADDDAAIACYRAVLEAIPAEPVAVAGLGKLYNKKQRWADLVRVLDLEVTNTDDPGQKAARLYKSAELLEARLVRVDEAVARYRECLALQPGYLPAQKALARIYENLGRWDDLVALLEEDVQHTHDRDQTIAVLTRVANIHEEHRKDVPAAMATLKHVLELAPNHLPTLRELARLCERAGAWEELIRTNELEVSLVGDSRRVMLLLHSNAETYEEQLKQKDRAIETYKKLLALSATYLPALKALGRLYAQAGRWTDLVDMYRQEAEITPSAEQAARLIFKAGELLEEKLGQTDDAIAAYQEVLTLSPNFFPALHALSRIYRAQKAWEHLVEVLRAEVAARTEASEKANTLFRVAALWEGELGRVDHAIESYQSALALVPDHIPATRAIERLFTLQANWQELAALFERELTLFSAPEHQIAVYEKLAVLYADRIGDLAHVERCYEAILALRPEHLGALKGLEMLRLGDRARRADVRARLAAVVPDARVAAEIHLAVAFDREYAGQDALADLHRAAHLAPDDPRLATLYVRALRRAEDWAGLAAWYEQRLTATQSQEVRVSLYLRLAELCEWSLGDDDRALAAFRAALELDPACLPALRGARRILTRQRAHADVYHLLIAEAEACRDARAAIDRMLEAGGLAETALKDQELARVAYQAVLARDPLETRAAERLEGLLLTTGGAAEIAELRLRRAACLESANDVAGAADEYVVAAQFFANDLQDEESAFNALDRALQSSPTHPAALQLRGDLCLAGNRYAEAAQAYFHRIEQGGDPQELAELNYRLGVLLQDHLSEPSRATPHLQAAWATNPGNVDALERLARIHFEASHWNDAAEAYARLVELTTEPAKVAQHLVAFAHVAEVGLGDAARAAGYLKRALDLSPGDPTIMEKLAELFERLGNLPDLALAFESQALHAARAGDKPRAYTLRQRAAELFARLSDLQKAIQNYRFAVEMAPDQVQPRTCLADLMARAGSMPAAAIEEHRAVLRIDPHRLESYHSLFRLFGATRQLDRAICCGHVLSFFKALTDVETASFVETRGRAPADTTEILSDVEMDATLQHPTARHPLADLMRLIGDQLHKVFEPGLAEYGVSRSDRLKPDHPLYKLAKSLCAVFGVEKLEVYQGKRGAHITLENTDPLSMVVGPDMVRRYQAREQRFLFARAAYQLRNKMAIAYRFDIVQLADLIGNTIRLVEPEFNRLGRPDPDMTKRLKKAMSGKAIRALELIAPELIAAKSLDMSAWLQASSWSADRAGLLLSGDIASALHVLLREDPSLTGMKLDTAEQLLGAIRSRRDMSELLAFVTSDDHFKLRGRLRLSLGQTPDG